MTPLHSRVTRVSKDELGGRFGADRGRKLVVTLEPNSGNDLLIVRPQGTRRPEVFALVDLYQLALRLRASREALERARAKKARNAARRAQRADDRARRNLKFR